MASISDRQCKQADRSPMRVALCSLYPFGSLCQLYRTVHQSTYIQDIRPVSLYYFLVLSAQEVKPSVAFVTIHCAFIFNLCETCVYIAPLDVMHLYRAHKICIISSTTSVYYHYYSFAHKTGTHKYTHGDTNKISNKIILHIAC